MATGLESEPRRGAEMQGMRDLLRSSLARSLRTLPDEDRLAAALPVVCGSALASHCRVDRLDELNGQRTLHLCVDSTEWLAPLSSMRDVLQRDLARISGVRIDHVQLEPLHRTPVRRSPAPTVATLPKRPRRRKIEL